MEEKIYAMWLSDALGAGSIYGKALIESYGSFSEIYRLSEKGYAEVGIKPGTAIMKRLLDKDTGLQEKNYGFCNHNYFGIIEYTADLYPKRLKNIADPPPVLYVRGRMIDFDDNVCIGVVGTRSYTDAGWNAVYKISSGLAKCGAVVVTGLASGIDTAANRAALEGCGYSVGIIGSGIERIYPSENTALFEEMYKSGLVITELSPFSNIKGSYFPVRNRIISGLCQGVLVGEGDVRSGAMITAGHAAKQGRHIFAVPGDINSPESSGVNKLIREGATPAFEAWDILEKYAYLYPHRIKRSKDTTVLDDIPKERSSKRVRLLGAKSSNTASAAKVKNAVKTDADTRTAEKPEVITEPVERKMTQAEITSKLECSSENERKVYGVLRSDILQTPDEISILSGVDCAEVLVALTFLEMDGLATHTGAGFRKI